MPHQAKACPNEVRKIADAFSDFLERALASGNRFIWLDEQD
ncbi:hypothetical protein [Myxococcus xanthus]|nr:hypothetical protein [Myxococcus xanthus]